MQARTKWGLTGLFVLAVAGTALFAIKTPTRVASAELRDALRDAIATRALAIESPVSIGARLDAMPVGVLDRSPGGRAHRQALWSLFFKGSLLKLGEVATERPLALFYNPYADVAVIQGCTASSTARSSSCDVLCALPGEALVGAPVTGAAPEWLSAGDPLQELRRIASLRLQAFDKAHPVSGTGDTDWQALYCKEKVQAAAELRLIDSAGALSELDPAQLRTAIADYVTDAVSPNSQIAGNGDDAVLGLLLKSSELSLAGAVRLGEGGWLVFLTPRQTGWRQAVLVLKENGKGRLSIAGARLFAISTAES